MRNRSVIFLLSILLDNKTGVDFRTGKLRLASTTLPDAKSIKVAESAYFTCYKLLLAFIISSVLLMFLPTQVQAQSWYNTSWQYRKAITIDYTKVGAGPHTNFPVLINITDANLQAGAQADFDDILFTSSNGTTKLDHEVESYTSGTGALVAWVEIPSLSSSANTVIYMYYGNAAATAQQNVTGTWNASFKGVYHLNNTFLDATSNAFNGTNTGTTNVTGKISNGRGYVRSDGDDRIIIPGLMGSPASTTVSAWANLSSSDVTGAEILSIGDHVLLRMTPTGADGIFYNGTTWTATSKGTNYSGAWHYISYTIAGGGNSQKLYIDGLEVVSTTNTTAISYAGLGPNTYIGAHANGGNAYDFDGTIDEVRVSATARSGGWVLTEYNNQNSPSTFYSVGAQSCNAPTTSNAGPDQTGATTCGLTTVTLAANVPAIGTGAWSIISGAGGTVTAPTSAASTFSGTAGTSYTLRWTISNSPCTASTDDVVITFNRNPTTSAAGPDQTGAATCGLTTLTLAANAPVIGTGAWSIISGVGGTVTTPSSRTSAFSGTAGTSYTLRWTISNSPCTPSTDDVVITFNQNPTSVSGSSTTTCVGGSTGTITASATGGTTPYTYSLNAGAYQSSTLFTGLAAATYTLNVKSNAGCVISTSVIVSPFANSTEDQNATATNTWVGHMYDGTAFTNYIGRFTEAETFDELFGGTNVCFNVVSNSVTRSIYTETFSVKYRMNSTKRGLYIVDLGSDDGSRLTVDGTMVYNNWIDQGISTKPRVLMNLNGASSLLYEFYENNIGNEVLFQNLTPVLANTLSTNATQSICLGNAGLAISGDIFAVLPAGITLSGTGYQWSYSTTPGGARINIAGETAATFSPSTAAAPFNAAGTYYIYRNAVLSSTNNIVPNPYVATNESNAATITVTTLPSATISYSGTPFCKSLVAAQPVTRTGTTGGTYTSTAGLTINASTGAITPGTSTAGTYTVTYTVTAAGGCSQFITTTSVTITPAPSATISYSGSPFCVNSGSKTVTLTGTAGGTFSAPGGLDISASTGAINSNNSIAGTYTVTYTVAASGGCPVYTATTSVTANAPNISQLPLTGILSYYPMTGNANDVKGTNTGTLQNSPALVADRFNTAASAYQFNGTSQYISTTNSYNNPSNFTISIWFKTNSTTGGRLIGFGAAKTGQSGNYDRHIYMNNAGQLYFGVYTGTTVTVSSARAYNDNQWHLATASLSSTVGMAFYVDGAIVGSNSNTLSAENFTGYWKIGYDNLNGWPSMPGSNYFSGNLDDALIYNTALSASDINTLYNSPDGAGNSGPVCSGSALNLTAPTVGGASYAWTGPNGFNSALQNPSFTYTAVNAGIYSLQVTAAGCTAKAFTTVTSSTNQGQWTGNISTDWADGANWCAGIVPTAASDVIITASAVRMPVIITTGACKSLTINSSASVTVSATGTLSLAGTLANNGTYTDNGTTVFNGTSGQQVFTGVTTFNNLTLNNSSGLLLPASLTVKKNLTLTTGILVVNAYNITVGENWINNSSVNALTAGVRTVTFNGTTAQSIGGSFATTFNDLIILNTANTVTLAANANIAGNLFVTSGTFDIASYTADRTTAGGTITVSNNSRLKIGGTNTFPVNYNVSSLATASTVEYAGTNQTVANKLYGNLTLSSATGAAVKTMPATAMTIEGNLSSTVGSGTSVSYTAGADITINGSVSIGAGTSFNGGSYITHISGNWSNSGTFNGGSGTVILNGAGSTVAGTGVQNFNNLTVAASPVTFSNATVSISGNLATTGAGAFTQAAGGTLVMTGMAKTITGSGISPDNLTISGSVTTASTVDLTGNLVVSGSFAASAGTFSLTGVGKTITGPGSILFSSLEIPGTITTVANFSVNAALSVIGNFTASAGTATFTGTSTLSGAPNLFNVDINGTSLQLSANSNLGIANVLTLTSGVLDAISSVPNTVNFNGNTAQLVNALAYSNLVLSNGNSKTAAGNLSTTHDVIIGTGTTFAAASYTITISGNWTNNGSFTAGTSNVEFVGDALAYLTGATTFNILTSNSTLDNSEIFLQSNVVASVVNMTRGIISTGTNTLEITNTRTGNGFIFGNIQRTHAFTTGVSYEFEGPNNTVNFSALSGVNSVTVSVRRNSIVDFPFGAAIGREYTIAVPAGTYTATLRLHYENAELNGNNENSMGLWNYNGSSWLPIGKTTNDATANYVEKTGLTNITNRWTCSDNSNLVQWNGSVNSDWNTAANWTVVQGSASAPPAATDIVNLGTVAFTHQPTISNAVAVKNINFGSVQAVTLSVASGGSLTSGDIHGEWAGNSTHTINANNQTITVNGNLTLSDNTAGHDINLTIGTGTVTILGSLEQAGAASVVFSAAGNLNIGQNFNYVSGVFTPGSGTVTYTGMDNQDMAIVNYNHLIISKTGGKASLNSTVTVAGNLTATGGIFEAQAPLAVLGNVTIANGATFNNVDELTVGGNWTNNGTYLATNGSIIFNGVGSQTISTSTFNNLVINKPIGTAASLTGDVILKGNFTCTSGTFDIGTYNFNRQVSGGIASIADAATFVIGANNVPDRFTGYVITPASTIKFDGTAAQNLLFPGIVLGNLILSNNGQKILYTPLTLQGNLTIESGATFNAGANTITLNGNWINNGNFASATSTVVLKGAAKTVTGITSFNRLTVTGSYIFADNMTLNGLLNITGTGSVSAGNTNVTTINADLIHSGDLYTLGTITFTGNVLQTVSLINAVRTFAVTVDFNGSVSPVLNSTSAPMFAILNINNTGGINPSVGYTVLNLLTVGTGASFNGGISTHDIMGSLVNNGTITSSGNLNFTPATAASINLGTNFTSTGLVRFGGAGAITLSGSPQSFSRVVISNSYPTGISPTSDWNMASNFFVNAGSMFNAGSFTHTVGGNISHPGVVNAGSSTFILNGSGLQDVSTTSGFNNLTINNSFGAVALYSDVTVAGVLNFVSGKINTGFKSVYQPAAGTTTGAAQNTGWVYGNMKKNIAPSYRSKTFEVGDSASYTPVSVVFSAVSSAGDLTVFTTAGDHPGLSSSPVNESKTVNRYWTILNSGIAFSNYDATFNFVDTDIDADVNTTALNVVIHNGSSWSIPVTASPNPTNIKATGLTSFDHFVIGEICNKGTAISYAASPYCANTGVATVTLTGTAGGIFSSDPGLSINAATGEVNLNTSVVGTYNVSYSVEASAYCGAFYTSTTIKIGTAGLWTGSVNSDWGNAGNWSCGGSPTLSSNVIIPNGMNSYPVITSTQTLHDIIIESGATVTINDGILKIYGSISNSGIFDVTNGTVEMSGSSAQIIPANAFLQNTIKNLVVSNDVSLAGTDTLTGTLNVAAGKTFTTNDFLNLKSNANGTARIAALPVDGAGLATAFITGKINIERYIPMRNAWRLVSAPLKSTGAPSINAAWQEGVTTASPNPNILPGYGVFIQGGSTTNGFDQGLTRNSSLKVYDNASNTFVGLPSTPGTHAAITSYPGYFLFVKGNRGIDLMQGTSAAITSTTLRMKGQVNTGNVTSNVNATGYTVFGNPYPSAIDFETLTRNNVRNGFYAWDPKLSGNYGLGGYVTASWDSIGLQYDFTASVSPVSQHIASGEAIMVQSHDSVNIGSIVVKESDKTSDGNDSLFGRSNGFNQRVRVNLLSANANGSTTLIDGILTTYDDDHMNVVNSQDAKKLTSGSENVGIKRDGKMLAIERRKTITTNDTTFLNLYQMKLGNYKLDITTNNMQLSNTVAVIKDSYSNTINNMPLDMNGVSSIPFSINSDPASYAINRFSIVFKPALVLPVTFTSVKAYPLQKNNVVEWTTDNELNIQQYEVEKSADGSVFATINTAAATATNGGAAAYKYIDSNPFDGNSYYRIRSVDISGDAGYSKTVKVNTVVVKDAPSINVYPNPVVGKTVSIQFKNIPKGNYLLQLFNAAGQLVSSKTILHNGTATTQNFEINEKFGAGKYELKLTGQGVVVVTALMKR